MSTAIRVSDEIAYHIYHQTRIWDVGDKLNTSIINRVFQSGCKKEIEEHLEKMRLALNRDLPSRYNCLFVCKKEDVVYWYNYFDKRKSPSVVLKIYEVELNGKLFWSDARYLDLQIMAYWDKKLATKEESKPEGLFEGDFTINRECTISEFQ